MANYKVELYGDVGFTADGSNILDFLTKEARDSYFNNLPHTTRTGTSVNKDFLDTGSIKLEVYGDDIIKYANASYMRVTSERFLPSTTEPSQEVTYLFITSYEVVSSTENATVIRYTVVNDNWMNYQFDIKLHPCSVERMHVDRWVKSSDKPQVAMPCMDLLEGYYNSISKSAITNEGISDSDDLGLICVVYTLGYTERNACPYRILVAPINNRSTQPLKCYDGEFIDIADIIDGTLANDLEIPPSAVISVYAQPLPSYSIVKRLGTDYYTVSFNSDADYTPRKIGSKYAYDFPLAGSAYTHTRTGAFTFAMPTKPTDGSLKMATYEPAMYRTPVRQYKLRYANIQFLLPQNLVDDLIRDSNLLKHISSSMPINMDGSSQYLYFGDSLEEAIAKGWAFEVSAIDGNVINDQWLEYLYTSRGADRAMMLTNMATLGLSDLGSTYVSGSIGYRSNMTQAQARNLEMQTQIAHKNQYDYYRKEDQSRLTALTIKELSGKQSLATTMANQSMMAAGIGGIAAAGANIIASYSAQENKESAIKNQPARVSSIGNIMTLMQSNQFCCELIINEVEEPVKSRYLDLFSKFGYYIGAVTQPNLRTRKFFNYLKTNGAIVTGDAPQTVLLNIASMFDAGTTIWHMDKCSKDTLYDYTYENIERMLI